MKKTFFLAWFLLCCGSLAFAQAPPVALAPVAHQQFFSQTGAPLASGCIGTFISGTSTPLATYTDGTGTVQLPNPIILDAGGFATIFLTNSVYRFVVTSAGGVNCATGTVQYTIDNVSAYSIINQAQNLFLSCQSSDPGGSAGELGCRSDLNRIRAFTTLWDTVVEETLPETLTNKTLTAPAVTNPTITGGGSWANPLLAWVNAQTGTSYTVASTDEQKLVTFSNASAVAVTLPQATTAGFGSGAVFHFRNLGAGAVTITPTVSTIDGIAALTLSSGQGVDAYSDGTNYETQRGAPSPAQGVDLSGQVANIPSTTLFTPSANGFYRFSCYTLDTQHATTSSTLPSCTVTFTDGDLNLVGSLTPCGGLQTTNTVGDTCTAYQGSGALLETYNFLKGGQPVKYSTSGYASSGATPLAYAVHFRIEGPF